MGNVQMCKYANVQIAPVEQAATISGLIFPENASAHLQICTLKNYL